jgi:hypothetical protein
VLQLVEEVDCLAGLLRREWAVGLLGEEVEETGVGHLVLVVM